ncbi:unnamed protein product [Rhizophagus irregularis]|nr:unnamed protein product [Rhizophagus irregularis]
MIHALCQRWLRAFYSIAFGKPHYNKYDFCKSSTFVPETFKRPSRRSSGNLNSNYFSTIWTSERPPLYKAVALNSSRNRTGSSRVAEVTAECATALTAFQSSTNQINIGDHGNDNYLIYSFTVLLILFDIHLWILKDLYCLKIHKGAWQNHLESNLKTLLLWIFDLIIKDATQYIYNRIWIWDPIFPNGEELLKEILTRIKSISRNLPYSLDL